MKILAYPVGELETNCYFVIDTRVNEAVIIDPGEEGERLSGELKKNNCSPVVVINTHGHIDHTGANYFFKKKYGVPVYIHEKDSSFLTDSGMSLSRFSGGTAPPAADKLLKDGDTATAGSIRLAVIHTPGHTPGSICLVLEDKYIFTGDTLFKGDVGRCDLPGGDEEALAKSLGKLKKLPASLVVLPGHGPASTIGDEIVNNPYLK